MLPPTCARRAAQDHSIATKPGTEPGTSFLLTLAWLGLQIADSARRRIKEKSLVRKSVSFMRRSLRIPAGRATKFTREQTAV